MKYIFKLFFFFFFSFFSVLDISHNGIKNLSGLAAVSNSLEILRANDNLLTTLPKQWEQKNGDVVVFKKLRELW